MMHALCSKARGDGDGFRFPYHRVATGEESRCQLAVVVGLCLTAAAALLAPRLVAAALLTARAPPNLVTIALTGGPCAGKTSTLSALEASAKSAGYHMMVTTEIATLMRAGGCDEAITPALAFQTSLVRLQV